MQDSTPLAFLL